MEEVTVFVDGTPIREVMLEAVVREYFQNLFFPNGLPWVVIVFDGIIFKGLFTTTCKILFVNYAMVAP